MRQTLTSGLYSIKEEGKTCASYITKTKKRGNRVIEDGGREKVKKKRTKQQTDDDDED